LQRPGRRLLAPARFRFMSVLRISSTLEGNAAILFRRCSDACEVGCATRGLDRCIGVKVGIELSPATRVWTVGFEVTVVGVTGTSTVRVWRLVLSRWTGGVLRLRLPSAAGMDFVREGSVRRSCVDLVPLSLLSDFSGKRKDVDGSSEVECRVLRIDFERAHVPAIASFVGDHCVRSRSWR
jgi:hypothetical protein